MWRLAGIFRDVFVYSLPPVARLDSIPPHQSRHVRMEIDVPDPRKWSAQTSELYAVELCLHDVSGNASWALW